MRKPLTILLLSIFLAPPYLLAQEPTLDSLKQTYEAEVQKIQGEYAAKEEQLLDAYARSLDKAVDILKQQGDPDKVLAAIAEKKRFGDGQNVPAKADTKLPGVIRDVQTGYHDAVNKAEGEKGKAFVDLTVKYVAALDRLMKSLTAQEKLDLALNAKAEKERVEFVLADVESKLGVVKPKVVPEELPRRQNLPSRQAASFFGLPPENITSSGTIRVQVGWEGDKGKVLSRSLQSGFTEFGFKIRAKWYHIIGVILDGVEFYYSRGHWNNSGAYIVENGEARREKDRSKRVKNASTFVPMSLILGNDSITWYYDGEVVAISPVKNPKKDPVVRLFFGSYKTTVEIRDVYVVAGNLPLAQGD